MPTLHEHRGIALPLAVFALVIVGLMVAAAFFIGRQEQSVGRNTVKSQQAFAAADAGAQLTVGNWDVDTYNALATGGALNVSGTVANGWYRGQVKRLNDQLFLVRTEGFSRDSTARGQVGLLIRLRPLEISIQAALETQGALRIGGSSDIDGADNVPTGWTCPPAAAPLPGIRITDSSLITTPGCSGFSCVSGSPQIEEDPAITQASLTTFGDAQFDDLRALATRIMPAGVTAQIQPSITGTTCNRSVTTNWGNPLNPTGPCGDYYPIVWADGDITINGVQGQGILIVNGDLRVQGGFEFYGPVIVRGSLSTTGTGGHFNGGVIAANINLDQNTVLGDAVISFSSCTLSRALQASASGALLRERSWANLY